MYTYCTSYNKTVALTLKGKEGRKKRGGGGVTEIDIDGKTK